MKSHGESSVEATGGTVPLGTLSPDQLERLQTDLQREVEMLSASLTQLSGAVARLTASKENAAQIGVMQQGREIMVPLTSSIYAPGRLAKTDKVLVDVGTGFYVEKSPGAAEKHFGRRATLLKEEADRATQLHTQKRQHLEAVNAVLQRKTAGAAAQSNSAEQ